MVHQQSDKRKPGKRSSGVKKPNRRADVPDPVPDVPAAGLPSGEPVWVKRDDGKIEINSAQINSDHFLGRPYIPGKQDCGSLIRDWYAENTGIIFPNYSRPDNWWQNGMNLFYEIYREEGFVPFDGTVKEMQIGDVMLMAYGCRFPNHSGLYVGDGKILQHLHGKLSSRDNIRSHNRDALLAIVRHPAIIIKSVPRQTLNLIDMLSPSWKAKLSESFGGEDEAGIKEHLKRFGEEYAARQAARQAEKATVSTSQS